MIRAMPERKRHGPRAFAAWLAAIAALTVLWSNAAAAQNACATARSPRPTPIAMSASQMQNALTNFGAMANGSFEIALNAGPGLAANAPALAAAQRAAAQWSTRISTPVRVQLRIDLAPLGTGIIGQASSTILRLPYDGARMALIGATTGETGDAIVSSLPPVGSLTANGGTGVGPITLIDGTKANLKALGFQNLDQMFGVDDAQITFSSNFPFDFSNSDGVPNTLVDFETVAAHEIGHALGFVSDVDTISGGRLPSGATTLDLFRFENDTSIDPASAAQFSQFPRSLFVGRAANFDDIKDEFAFSTGVQAGGDGRQASHWKDGDLSGILIGVMDPTLGNGQIVRVADSDLRAVDVIGYNVAFAGDPGPPGQPRKRSRAAINDLIIP